MQQVLDKRFLLLYICSSKPELNNIRTINKMRKLVCDHPLRWYNIVTNSTYLSEV